MKIRMSDQKQDTRIRSVMQMLSAHLHGLLSVLSQPDSKESKRSLLRPTRIYIFVAKRIFYLPAMQTMFSDTVHRDVNRSGASLHSSASRNFGKETVRAMQKRPNSKELLPASVG
jgi:hypothetical protein